AGPLRPGQRRPDRRPRRVLRLPRTDSHRWGLPMNARQHSSTRARTVRGVATIATAALAGVALGSAGASLALWNDSVTFTGEISSGYEYFAAGPVGATVPATNGQASMSIGAAE